jgi:4-hydroxyphenylpyruvate dioxygenase
MNSHNNNRFFLNFILLGGTTAEKVAATRAAGFDEAEVWREDVEAFAPGATELGDLCRAAGLALTDVMVLRDFPGAPPRLRNEKRQQAIEMMEIALAIGTDTVQCPATTLTDFDPAQVDGDLRWLACEAASRGLRVSYEAICWSTLDSVLPEAWARVQRLDEPNLGLAVDVFHICARGRDVADLFGIPMDRIYQLQLSDLIEPVSIDNREHLIHTARHHRVLPGRGRFDLAPFVRYLQERGYSGVVGVEVFSDELKALPADDAARRAMAALREVWGGE